MGSQPSSNFLGIEVSSFSFSSLALIRAQHAQVAHAEHLGHLLFEEINLCRVDAGEPRSVVAATMRRCWCRWLSAMMTTVMLVQPDVDGEARTRLTLSKTS